MYSFLALSFLSLNLARYAAGHVALWHPSMFGRCGDDNQCVNTAQPVEPLQDMTFDKWWWHGYLDFPPENDTVMELPAGKTITVELASNVAFTNMGQHPEAFWPGGAGNDVDESIIDPDFWNNGTRGNLHTTGHADVAGCALSIAYTDDPKVVRPEDMVIFSVQQDCPWHRDATFDIPADMPPCPNGKCMCSWWWIHNSDGGTDQIYQTAFQCNVTYAPGQKISTTPVGRPVPPVKCDGDKSKCIAGPKMPMYWKNEECNNMPEPGHFAPTYGDKYGFFQGAQNDIFQTINTSNYTCPQSKAAGVFASQTQSPPSEPEGQPGTNGTEPEPQPEASNSVPPEGQTGRVGLGGAPTDTPVDKGMVLNSGKAPKNKKIRQSRQSRPLRLRRHIEGRRRMQKNRLA